MKILHLSLKKEWYEMIESGVKTEEYREIKPYWEKRLIDYKGLKRDYQWIVFRKTVLGKWTDPCEHYPKGYTHVKFSYGYTKRTMTFECKGITIGKGKAEWGAPDNDVFIIKLGKKL
jgi:hypothetical protein